MTPRTAVSCLAVVTLIVVAVAGCRRDPPQRSTAASRASADAPPLEPSTCHGMWERGLELEGVVGGRRSQAYFDTWPAPGNGGDDLVSGIVVFPDPQRRDVLADTITGLKGGKDDF